MLVGVLWDRVISAKKERTKEEATMRGRDIWQEQSSSIPAKVRRCYHRVHPGRGEMDKYDDTVRKGVNPSPCERATR